MIRKTILLLSAIFTVATAGQAQQSGATPSNKIKTETNNTVQTDSRTAEQTAPDAAQQTSSDAVAPDPESPNTAKKRYRLQPSDVLHVTYRYSPEYDNRGVVVQPDGYISLELIGNVRVAGLTLDQTREKIKTLASERLQDPEVTVVLQEFIKPYFVVAGEVSVPGKFDLRDNTSALQAVLLAGGFKDSARASQVLLIRRYNAEVVEVVELKLNDLAKGSKLREDALLQSGDMIYVPRNRISKIERFVKTASAAAVFGFLF